VGWGGGDAGASLGWEVVAIAKEGASTEAESLDSIDTATRDAKKGVAIAER
jgi:hypothetical protein